MKCDCVLDVIENGNWHNMASVK